MLRSASIANRRRIVRIVVVLCMAATVTVLMPTTSAFAATTLTVTTTADTSASGGACGDSEITAPPSPLSLREATCLANNIGGDVTIDVPAGEFDLDNGELAPGQNAGQVVTIAGAGSSVTTISAQGLSRVFDIDPNSVGGVNSNLSGLRVILGADSTFGGAGILAGSGNSEVGDVMTMSDMVITGNQAGAENPDATNVPGGGMQFLGGQLTITNSTFLNNSSHSSPGSGLVYWALGFATPESLSVTDTTFSGNSATNSNESSEVPNGGALALLGESGNYTVTHSRFVNNSVTATTGPAVGGGIWVQGGTLSVTGSTFSGNTVAGGAGSPAGSAIYSQSGSPMTLHYNRIVGNSAVTGSSVQFGEESVDAASNWWGCNGGPGQAGCDTITPGATVTPRLVLAASANPATVTGPNATSAVHALLTTDSAGGTVTAGNLAAFDGLKASFSDPPGDATVGGSAGTKLGLFSGGDAGVSYESHTTTGPDPVNVTLDNATAVASLTVDQPPAITSANTAHFDIGTPGSFTVTTTGFPNPAITKVGTLPSGLTFHDNGDGSATVSGTATAGGIFPLNLTANNGVAPNATQTLNVTVTQAPAFTSASTATFTIGSAGSFTVTTSGLPTVSTITESGTLPAGMTFTDNGNGTATLAGTPTGTGNTYPVTLTATNGVSPNGSQVLTIQVNQAPAVTTNPSDQTVQPGTSVTFTAAASGVPTPTVQWQRSTDGGASFPNIAGAVSTSYTFTAAAGDDGNQYHAVFTNGVGSPATTTAATLHVGTAPAFTSANITTFAVGSAGNFVIATSGLPSATLSRTGSQFPAWLTLTDNGDGTGTLTGTPPAGSAGQYQFTLKAANGFSPSASQIFTLNVDDSPVITSANHATFTVGTAGSFAVTTTAGFPTTTTITKPGGTLPSGVTFTDNGDGTATIAGTPAAGSTGTYPFTISATAVGGVTAPATQSFTLTVNGPPAITSADHTTFGVGAAGSFTVTTTAGHPAPMTLSKTGTLPSGVSFTDNGDGTATLAGTPALGTGGIYSITITASNGISPDATQAFTLTVNEPPVITSANHATFTLGTASAFTVTTASGQPAATTLTQTGTLPAGITFTDNGDGTATLGGTPTGDGTFPLTITASNGVNPDPTQSFTLTVNAPPTITSADHTTFRAGTAGSFTVTTTPGTPAATTITETGTLPDGVSFTDNGDGTATLAGTPTTGTGRVYPLTITASNGVLPSSTQTFTLTVNEPPTITSADHTTFTLGAAGSFTVTTTAGQPAPTTITETGTLPAGVTFTDNGDGTATLAGTPTGGGVFALTIRASNGVSPDATQSFTLTVNNSPSITSADHTTFAVGTVGSFTVTTTPGTPTTTTLTETGGLPNGVTFTDNGDGTGTLAGTPAARTGDTYSLMFTASNGILPSATQEFTLTVTDVPSFTSADNTTFSANTADTFTVTTMAGFPSSTTLTETGTLPPGVSFVDNGDGTATLSGTPDNATGGLYQLTLTATNTAGHTDQPFDLTVTESPAITSDSSVTFTAGTAGTFTVTTLGGFPRPPTLTEDGALPDGVTFTDNGDGTATLAGTATAGGVFPLTITASNGETTDSTQPFALTVNGPPSITSGDAMTFTAGVAGTFSVTTNAGVPSTTTLSVSGSLPDGVTFTDNGDGTGTLAGTAPPSALGAYQLTVTASNTIAPDTTQAFTLTIARAAVVPLPPQLPDSDGSFDGVPPQTGVGAVMHLTGSGFAAGAPITIGIYSTPMKLATTTADSAGRFAVDVRVPNLLGRHTVVAAGRGADNLPRYVERVTVIHAPAAASGSSSGGGSTGLASTGPDTNLSTTLEWAAALLLCGLMLLAASRRHAQPVRAVARLLRKERR